MNREKQSFTTHSCALGDTDIGDRAGVAKLFAEPCLKRASEFFRVAL